MPDRYFCQECGYTATSPGNCPTCNIELIETDDGFETENQTMGKYTKDDLDGIGDEMKDVGDDTFVKLDKVT